MSHKKNWITLLDKDVWTVITNEEGTELHRLMLTDYSIINGRALLTIRLESGVSIQISMGNVEVYPSVQLRVYDPIELHPTQYNEYSPRVVFTIPKEFRTYQEPYVDPKVSVYDIARNHTFIRG